MNAPIEPKLLQAEEETQALIDKFLTSNAGFKGPDPVIMEDHKYAPRTAAEERILSGEIDTHLYQEIRSRLVAVLDENMDISEQTVAAPAAKFSDLSTAYMTSVGDTALLCNRGVAGFAIVMHYPVRHILKYFKDDPTVGLRPGDAFLVNDARFGGIHSADQSMVMPCFHEGELVAWTVCAMHEGEVGARPPGGMGPSIESPYEEGFRGSPIKIAENYQLKADLVTLVQNAVREKEVMLVDLRARLATCMRLGDQLTRNIGQYGVDAVVGTLRHTLELVAQRAAERLRELPKGTVRGAFYMDSTSREAALIKINVAITIDGDRCIVDLRGSSPEIANRPINTGLATIKIGFMVALMHYFWPDLPKSPAVIQHFDFITDPKSLLACSYETPIAMNVATGFKAITACEVLFSKLYFGLPNKYATIKAPWYNQPAGMMYGGTTQHGHDVGNICADLNGMAGGARANRDGEHAMCASFAQMNDIGESEDTEENLPVVMFSSKMFVPDLVSFGKYRGGAGYQTMYTRYGHQPFGFQAIVGGSKFSSTVGLFGGYGSPCYPLAKIKGINVFEELQENPLGFEADIVKILNERPFRGASYETVPGTMEFELAFEGELYVLHQGTGGGYGDVLERDPELVMKDLAENIISARTARELYGVVFDETTHVVDEAATQAARAAQRRARLQRGITWDALVDSYVTKSPPVGMLYFGNWNGSEKLYGGMYQSLPGQFPRDIHLPDPKLIYEAVLKRKVISGVSTADAIQYDAMEKELNQPLSSHSLRKLARVSGLMTIMAGRIGLGAVKSLFNARGSRSEAFQKRIGKALAKYLLDAGPTFIKLGQVWSTRPDLLGVPIASQLAKLQDDVDPMPADVAVGVIEKSFGKPLSELYREFERKPVAAGSVAQVHRAVLHDGRVVAVKVKRPDLEERVSADMGALSALLALLRLLPGVKQMQATEMISELGRAVRGQMDFRQEVANNRRFASDLAKLEWCRLPEVYDPWCSDEVITMEFIEGQSPSAYIRQRGSADPVMAERIYRMYIQMAFGSRFLHADLHSGNLMIDKDGKVVVMDTGLAHEFPSYYTKRYLRAYLCIAAADGYLQGDNYLGDRPHMASPETRKAISFDLHVMYQKWTKERKKDLTTLWLTIMMLVRKHKVALDRELMMMMVADITMSGIVHEFDPDFDVVEFIRQELPKLIFEDGKLALNDPFLLAAARKDLLRDIRSAMGIELPDIDFTAA